MPNEVKIPALPASWPNDGRARIRTGTDGQIHAMHPQRERLVLINGKWLTTEQKNTEENHAKR